MSDVDNNSAATACSPRRCEKCRDMPLIYFDEKMNGWDCVHVCGDRFYGAVNQPTRDMAIEKWNSLVCVANAQRNRARGEDDGTRKISG